MLKLLAWQARPIYSALHEYITLHCAPRSKEQGTLLNSPYLEGAIYFTTKGKEIKVRE